MSQFPTVFLCFLLFLLLFITKVYEGCSPLLSENGVTGVKGTNVTLRKDAKLPKQNYFNRIH